MLASYYTVFYKYSALKLSRNDSDREKREDPFPAGPTRSSHAHKTAIPTHKHRQIEFAIPEALGFSSHVPIDGGEPDNKTDSLS